ncbi:MAG: hypothetical protein OEM19_00820 [Deltaproteobacteria bacterium]|jgi:hypothetical protein|nr:hypothetical protein [Deltaproteobacteria bacterium]
MRDFLRGCVMSVLDGNAIEIEITHTGNKNRGTYNGIETIHITEIKPFLLLKKNGYRWKPFLEKMLLGKEVSCLVNSHTPGGEIEADVYLL